MTMAPSLRKLALTLHITFSIGWLGSVAAFLILAVVGLNSPVEPAVRACYIGMDLITKFAILPACLASLLTGLVSSLGTSWGLFRHYWVLIKFLLTLGSTVILLLHTSPITRLANAAIAGTLASSDFHELRVQMLADSVAAIVVLLVNTILAVYKPKGLTKYGLRTLTKP